jgi:hypothetical protein
MTDQRKLSVDTADSQFERSRERPLTSFEEMRRSLHSSAGPSESCQPKSFADLIERFGASTPRG